MIRINESKYRKLGALVGYETATGKHKDMDGTPITVVQRQITMHGVCRPQFSMSSDKFRCYLMKSVSPSLDLLHAWNDEGVTWIRGLHEPNSPEAAALLVAYALGKTA